MPACTEKERQVSTIIHEDEIDFTKRIASRQTAYPRRLKVAFLRDHPFARTYAEGEGQPPTPPI
jgi:hypothetical protein